MKELIEKRNDLIAEMEALLGKSNEEKRALNEDEVSRFAEIKKEIESIDTTIQLSEESRGLDKMTNVKETNEETRALEVAEEKRFLEFVKGEKRDLSAGSNGAIIPVSIANKIIDKVRELSPIYAKATIFNVGGDLKFPVYDYTQHTTSYVDEFNEVTASAGTFTSVELKAHVIGTLAKVSRSLMNRADFDVLGYVVKAVAQSIADFLEKELINGTAGKLTGVLSSTNSVETAAASTVTADDIIDLQMAVPEQLQGDAGFILHKNTLKALRKLKDENGQYLLNKDATTAFGWSLLGKPVYVSENMPQIADGNKAIVYGDFSGLYVKLAQNVEVQVLNELYAAQHAVGVSAFVEADSKIVEPQKIAVLVVKSA